MADKDKDQITPPSTESGTDEPKTYSGKFTSVEELEKGYEELEKVTAANNERLAQFEKRLDNADEASIQPAAEPETTAPAPTKTDYLARFYADPEALLTERDKATEERTMQRMDQKYQAQRLMDGYYRDNPDLSKHEGLLEFQFSKTPMKLGVQERLDQAGKKVREMLKLAKGQTEPGSGNLTSDNYVEGPSGERVKEAVVEEKLTSPDEELALYMKDRKAEHARTLSPPSPFPGKK